MRRHAYHPRRRHLLWYPMVPSGTVAPGVWAPTS